MKQMSEEYTTKWVKVLKRRGQNDHLPQGDEQNKFIYYNNKTYIDT